ncbi:hypothetical protein Ptr902_06205 [Pyrenophora tritici-repentis]|uniref:Uncharacterized protein n=1 Tax=Pyrenophora tritici-repentis TaxID=45151 RepID=A0A5M9LHH8_9PLEO|nr:hypothetical protein PtrV1_00700 [Pyrenophora tritici-repentis]KAI0574477.1 hypothetical protein Alg215_08574 [Pyrenophora tritici-repentis]KAI0588709.1 hypothetical protein Alg130_03249 [Pyrenophora tritici-repentis]KAI0612475.1 hypothetical protein TUN205_03281 [Pyrenophora tritici-repentis]KAI0625576.1 hypothetical protein TUN199_02438 [Pyrenophora tritici-repentis]
MWDPRPETDYLSLGNVIAEFQAINQPKSAAF